jgi:hypothetical protein
MRPFRLPAADWVRPLAIFVQHEPIPIAGGHIRDFAAVKTIRLAREPDVRRRSGAAALDNHVDGAAAWRPKPRLCDSLFEEFNARRKAALPVGYWHPRLLKTNAASVPTSTGSAFVARA